MSYEYNEDLNEYDDYDQSEPIEIENENIGSGNYEFLIKEEIEKERKKKLKNLKNIVHYQNLKPNLFLLTIIGTLIF